MKASTKLIIAAALLPLAAPGAAVVQNFWDFEGGYADKAGAADGTAGGEVTTTTGWNGNTAAVFPAAISGGGAFNSTGYVDLPAANVYNSGSNAFSMSYWFRIADDGTTNARGIFDFSSDSGVSTTQDGPQSLYVGSSSSLAFRIDGLGGGGAATYNNGGAGFEDDQWHFVVATYDPSLGIELHVDGFGVDASTGGFGTVNWDPDQYLGAFNVSTQVNRGLDGALDDVAIYDGLLSEAQITGLFNGTISPLQIPEPSAALLGTLAALGLLRRRR